VLLSETYVNQSKRCKKSEHTLHERFFEDNTKQLNLFVMGVGNVGRNSSRRLTNKIPEGNPKMNLRVIAV
jgi:aspartokinase/homoserine dehydrogenase 1